MRLAAQFVDHLERRAVHLVIAEDGEERDRRIERAAPRSSFGTKYGSSSIRSPARITTSGLLRRGGREDLAQARRAGEEPDVQIGEQRDARAVERRRKVRDRDRHALDAQRHERRTADDAADDHDPEESLRRASRERREPVRRNGSQASAINASSAV